MKNLKEKLCNNDSGFVIAIDGPSASGKGSISKILAKKYDLKYIESSIVYRGLAYLCLKNEIEFTEISKIIALSETKNIIELTKNADLHREDIGIYTSKISAIPEVRHNLNLILSKLIFVYSRVVIEGRDITTIVAQDADIKIFITANIHKRAFRRYNQLRLQGKKCILSEVLKLLEERDNRDISRNIAPLRVSPDAFVLDTSNITEDEAIIMIEKYIEFG